MEITGNNAHNQIGRRQVFREEIRDEIRNAIVSGALKPGDRIIETFWAKEMGVSQGPVREAIRDLEGMGLVETVPFKGSRVRTITKKDIQDNYSVRICLEAKSIKDALTLLSDAALKELYNVLSELLDEMDICANRADLIEFTECDTAFHKAIIDTTDNPVLLKLWEQCNMRNWFMVSELTDVKSLKALHHGHSEIAEAIKNRDISTATSTLTDHLTEVMDGYIERSFSN